MPGHHLRRPTRHASAHAPARGRPPRADTEADGDPAGETTAAALWRRRLALLSAGWWRRPAKEQWSLFHDLGRRSALLHRLRPWYGPVTAILADDNPDNPECWYAYALHLPVFMSSPAITTRYCGTVRRQDGAAGRRCAHLPGVHAMRFAVHVLVHEHPRLFAALIASLQHEQIDVYAHVDDTSRQDLFESAAPGCRCRSRFSCRGRAG